MNKSIIVFLISIFLLATDWYVWNAIKVVTKKSSPIFQKIIRLSFWSLSILSIVFVVWFSTIPPGPLNKFVRVFLLIGVIIPYGSKIFSILFLLIDDLRRLLQWIYYKIFPTNKSNVNAAIATSIPPSDAPKISRSTFMAQTSLVAGGALLGTFGFGILSGAHDYRVKRIKVPLKNLPRAFHGLRIAQISDIHTGSFYNKKAVLGGIEMLLNEKPDVAFFTGDFVNDKTEEIKEYFDVFSKVKAPMGVYSVLGNHDYGDYARWKTPQEKEQNFADMIQAHAQLGWRLLMDEHVPLQTGNEQIGVLGVQNWGMGFAQYGSLEKTYAGAEDYPVKLLLSHDPTHWKAQVLPDYKAIDVMFAGHTHGMQFGIETPAFRWSPAQYRYDHWAGLYQEEDQYLYVNRGYGYIGYPGRVGILPEITIMELVKA